MSEIIEINGKHLVFNLNWRELAGFGSEKKEIKSFANEINALHYVRYKGKSIFCGFLSSALPKGVKTPLSAAVLFAAHCGSPDAVLISNIGEGQYALVALRDGVPVPGLDIIGTGIEVSDVAKEFISESGEKGVTLFGDASEFFQDTHDFSFDELSDEKDKEATLVPIGANKSSIFLILLLVGVIVGGYVGYEKWQEAQRQALLDAQKVDPVKQYIENVRSLLQKDTSFSAPVIGKLYHDQLSGITLLHNTWQFSRVQCIDLGCSITWNRGFGTNNDFIESTKADPLTFQYAPDGSWINQTISFQSTSQPTPLTIEQIPSLSSFVVNTGSFFQRLQSVGLRTEIRQRSVYGQVAGVPVPPNVPGGTVEKGTWSISGDYAMMMDSVRNLPNNLTIGMMQVDISTTNTLNFKIEGNYYVRK